MRLIDAELVAQRSRTSLRARVVRLRAKGWVVHPQIGVSGFRIDLGVVDPDLPGAFLAGVECDGATYHRGATARDRDRLRQAVLEGLGWRILRIWSTDWWTNAGRETERLHTALEAALPVSSSSRELRCEMDRSLLRCLASERSG